MQDYNEDVQNNLQINEDTENVESHETDELDDILSDLTADADEPSSDDEDEAGETGESTNVQQQKKPSRWKRKQQYLTQAREEAEKLAIQRERENAELRARLEAQEKMWSQILGPIPPEQAAQPQPGSQGSSQPLDYNELKKTIKQELMEEQRKSSEEERAMAKLASQWRPQLERMSKQLSKDSDKSAQFSDWFGKYTRDVGDNREKRMLLEVAGNLEYAAEALYTVNKSNQFANLSLADKISALYKLHTDIVGKRKKQSESDKSIGMPKNGAPGGGMKNKPIGEYTTGQAWDLYKSRAKKR